LFFGFKEPEHHEQFSFSGLVLQLKRFVLIAIWFYVVHGLK